MTVASPSLEAFSLSMQASDAAWGELQAIKHRIPPGDALVIRRTLTLRIMQAVREGERDPERLKSLGLNAIERRLVPPI